MVAGGLHTGAIRLVAAREACEDRRAAEFQVVLGREGEHRVPFDLGQYERWHDPFDDAVEQARQQRIRLGDEGPLRQVRGVCLRHRLEEGRVAGDVGQQERATSRTRMNRGRTRHAAAPFSRALDPILHARDLTVEGRDRVNRYHLASVPFACRIACI
jgi:hypothetical protein